MKYRYIVLAVSILCFIWLNFGVVPDLVVALVQDPSQIIDKNGEVRRIEEARRGTILTNITTPSSRIYAVKMTGNQLKVLAYARGWDAVMHWWPFALACTLGGGLLGGVLGSASALDIYKKDADRRIQNKEYKLENAGKKLQLAEEKVRQAETLFQQAEQLKRQAQATEKNAINLIQNSEIRANFAASQASEAEGKLGNERERHKEAMRKSGGVIKELRAEVQKLKNR